MTLLSWPELLARERPSPPDARLPYGVLAGQFLELWRPDGRPKALVILIHGGCWRADLPGLELMDLAAADLAQRGFLVANLEYRRIGEEGGGWPGTFLDIALALERTHELAQAPREDLATILVGHSAGGHLALWAAARRRIAASSPLFSRLPFAPDGVVTLAGINDLSAYRKAGAEPCGGPGVIDALTGGAFRPDPFSDASPAALLPLGIPQRVISGERDPIVPPRFGEAYAAKAARAGDPVREVTILGAGHFELIDPAAPAWDSVVAELEDLAGDGSASLT
ncbi:MAG: alpha/beta hydrolase family protein [Caulobacteraceae bacterium]